MICIAIARRFGCPDVLAGQAGSPNRSCLLNIFAPLGSTDITTVMVLPQKVSIHGGHSGEFCNHAADSLEDIVKEYIRQGFSWVGITEHAPGISEELLYADERDLGMTPEFLFRRFGDYMRECRRLQHKYREQILIYAGMETETYRGYRTFVPYLLDSFAPDYIVGSVHFVNEINFDYSAQTYLQAAESAGGIDALYRAYFDVQYEMINEIKPAVVGHFDLIRIFDPDYRLRLRKRGIWERIERNLKRIRDYDLILDFNLRAMFKGAEEPYVSSAILRAARKYDVTLVPGDDSHSVATVGAFLEEGVAILQNMGFTTDWRKPVA